MLSISQAMGNYLNAIKTARSKNTADTYTYSLKFFTETLRDNGIDPDNLTPEDLPEDAVASFAAALKRLSPATESLYLTAVVGFYEYLAAEELSQPNLQRVRLLVRHRSRKPGQRLPQFPKDQIDTVIDYAINLASSSPADPSEYLRNMRDRAFLLTLADTGLRVHEACQLRRGDLDWNEGKAVIIGKGDRQAVVRFTRRSLHALKDYLTMRNSLDGSSRKPLASLPLFARHDRGAGNKIKPITTATGRNIVNQRVSEALGAEAVGTITPHSFRHYFVTAVLQGSGGNLKMAQELARHRNIAVTQRYAHLSDDELDKGYWEVFEGETR